MIELLQQRRAGIALEMESAQPGECDKLRREVAHLDEQIGVLQEEAGITRFVEDAVRVSLEMRRLQ